MLFRSGNGSLCDLTRTIDAEKRNAREEISFIFEIRIFCEFGYVA